VSRVRREVAAYLEDCPVRDDMVLIADELAANCCTRVRVAGSSACAVSCRMGRRGSS
jgi:hypothetical protein